MNGKIPRLVVVCCFFTHHVTLSLTIFASEQFVVGGKSAISSSSNVFIVRRGSIFIKIPQTGLNGHKKAKKKELVRTERLLIIVVHCFFPHYAE